MKTVAQELARLRIRVNTVAPGGVRTPINREAWSTPEAYQELMQLVPIERIAEPEEIGCAALFRASEDADYITGATLYADGGSALYFGFEANGCVRAASEHSGLPGHRYHAR